MYDGKSNTKDYVIPKQLENYAKGLRNAERARTFVFRKTLMNAIVSSSFSLSLICPSMSITR